MSEPVMFKCRCGVTLAYPERPGDYQCPECGWEFTVTRYSCVLSGSRRAEPGEPAVATVWGIFPVGDG